ncbi:endonuclease domain-containing protein [Rhodococcus sp. NPDC055024]
MRWSVLPSAGVTAVRGAPLDVLQIGSDPLPDCDLAIVSYRVADVTTAARIVDEILGQLESAALSLFPAWLPGGHAVDFASKLDTLAAGALARRLAATSDHFGPFVEWLATSSVAGRRPACGTFSRETRAVGLARVISSSYGRSRLALLLAAPDDLSVERQRALSWACEWLNLHGDVVVWLTGTPIPDVDRFPVVTVPWESPDLPVDFDSLATPYAVGESIAPRLSFPPVAGRPHPGSKAELTLETAMATAQWAVGRQWNPTYQPNPLRPPIRVDLLWADEKCIVEIDGDDHRSAYKYAADRLRDNTLHLDGFTVLRFTNQQVSDDLDAVLRTVETLLSSRRENGTVERRIHSRPPSARVSTERPELTQPVPTQPERTSM